MHHLYKIGDGSSVRPSEACPERAWSGPTQGESAGGSVCSVGKDTGAVCVREASDKVSTACPQSPACHAGLRHPVRVPHGLALGTARAASPAQTGPGHVELPPLCARWGPGVHLTPSSLRPSPAYRLLSSQATVAPPGHQHTPSLPGHLLAGGSYSPATRREVPTRPVTL